LPRTTLHLRQFIPPRPIGRKFFEGLLALRAVVQMANRVGLLLVGTTLFQEQSQSVRIAAVGSSLHGSVSQEVSRFSFDLLDFLA
jgi:hypothetical protein